MGERKTSGGLAGRLRRLRDDRRGTTAVEFGLLAMPFLAVVLGIFEVAYVEFQGELLQSSINTAYRQMLTGQMQGSSTPVTTGQQFVSTYLCQAGGARTLPSQFDCGKLVVDVRTATSFAASDETNDVYKTSGTFCPGAPGQVVMMRVTYPLPSILPLDLLNATAHAGVVGDVPGQAGWFHILEAEALFQEENYALTYAPPSGC